MTSIMENDFSPSRRTSGRCERSDSAIEGQYSGQFTLRLRDSLAFHPPLSEKELVFAYPLFTSKFRKLPFTIPRIVRLTPSKARRGVRISVRCFPAESSTRRSHPGHRGDFVAKCLHPLSKPAWQPSENQGPYRVVRR